MIFILTHRRGFEADRIIDRLRSLGEPFFRFNTDLFDAEPSCSVLIGNQKNSFRIFCDDRELDLTAVTAAWFQQPISWPQPLTPFELARQTSHKALIDAVLSKIRCKWINAPEHALRASNKPLQLLAAGELGLDCPETLISNHPNEVRAFVRHKECVVAKSAGPQWVSDSQGDNAAYTQRVDIAWLKSDESISFAPVTYQTFHRRNRDVRVVIVGDHVFAVSCTAQEDIQRYDIRKGSENSYQCFNLPETVGLKLKQLMDRFDINFCSADFIENDEGALLFVDLNVTGSWWWIDSVFEGRIADAITSLLLQLKADR